MRVGAHLGRGETPPVPASSDSGTLWWGLRFAVVVVFCAAIIWTAALFTLNARGSPYPWVNHDVAYLTYAGSEILAGSRLYVDFEEVNPPGAPLLQAGIVAVADLLRIEPILLTHLVVLAFAVAGLLLLRATWRPGEHHLVFALVTLAYLLVAVRGNFSNNVVPSAPWIPYDFGQREQLFALLFLPYLLWRITRSRRPRLVDPYLVVLGYVAGFKPYWVVLVAVVEAYALARRRDRWVRGVACLLGGMALPYGVLIALSPESFAAFFGELVPLVLRGGYSHYGMDLREFLASPLHVQMVAGCLLFGICFAGSARMRVVDRATLWLCLFVVAVGYASVLHQAKYWSYHAMLLFGSVIVLVAFLLARILESWRKRRLRLGGAAVCVLLAVAVAGSSLRNLELMLRRYPPKGWEIVSLLEGHRKAMFFSMAVDYAYAPLVLRTETVGPWRAHFRIPVILEIEDARRREAALDEYARAVSARIERERPDVLLFAPYRAGLPPGVSLHDLLSDHGAVPEHDYVRVPDGQVGAGNPLLHGWVVYERREGAGKTQPGGGRALDRGLVKE